MKRYKTIHNQEYAKLINELVLERKRLGLSQHEVAEAISMSQSEISKIETIERRVDVFEFRKLIEVYRITENSKLRNKIRSFFNLGE